MTKPEIKSMYEAAVTESKKSAYVVALTDYLNALKIHFVNTSAYVGAVDDLIVIKATDDFKVMKVKVTIIGIDGAVVESGEAEAGELIRRWAYKAKAVNANPIGSKVRVTAVDMPGNETTLEQIVSV